MKNSVIAYIIIATLIGGAGGFLGGIKFQEQQRPSMSIRTGTRMMQGETFLGKNANENMPTGKVGIMGRPIFGTITSSDETSLTVSQEDGSSKIIMLSDQTTLTISQSATKTDLKSGIKISVIGKENTDGSFTATSVMLNPQERVQISN